MISLEKTSGLPISMKEDYSLVLGEGVVSDAQDGPTIREFSKVKNFLKDPGSAYHRKDVYQMYRNVALAKHDGEIRAARLSYDITVIPPGKMGDEFAKTIGHYHEMKPGTGVRYPEVYEVLYGKVFWLIQSATPDLEQLLEVYLIEAERGEKAVIPAGFGHISINPTDDVLVMSNWQPYQKANYEPYEAHQGGAYYVVESQRLSSGGGTSSGYDFAPNLNYKSLPELRRARPRELPQYGLRSALPMYFTATADLRTLDFLSNPENYLEELTAQKVFSKI